MASKHTQKTKPPSAIPMMAPLETLVCAEGEEEVGASAAVATVMLEPSVTDKVTAVADAAFGRKSAASAGSFDRKAAVKSVWGH